MVRERFDIKAGNGAFFMQQATSGYILGSKRKGVKSHYTLVNGHKGAIDSVHLTDCSGAGARVLWRYDESKFIAEWNDFFKTNSSVIDYSDFSNKTGRILPLGRLFIVLKAVSTFIGAVNGVVSRNKWVSKTKEMNDMIHYEATLNGSDVIMPLMPFLKVIGTLFRRIENIPKNTTTRFMKILFNFITISPRNCHKIGRWPAVHLNGKEVSIILPTDLKGRIRIMSLKQVLLQINQFIHKTEIDQFYDLNKNASFISVKSMTNR